MKWILVILCGLALQAGAITNGVFATKSPYLVESATMPFNLWTNSVLWLTAESPVLNAGATNAEWICYAKNCAGNATQTTIASQPTTIVTNGVKALSFDGGDAVILPSQPAYSGTNSWSLLAWINVRQFPIDSQVGYIASVYDISTSNASWSIQARGPTAGGGFQPNQVCLLHTPNGFSQYLSSSNNIPSSVFTVGFKHLAFTVSAGRVCEFYINGTPYGKFSTTFAALNLSSANLYVGGNQSSLSDGLLSDIADVRFFTSALSTNQIYEIYNSGKGLYGL